jgi:fumarate hydratase class II
VGRETREAVENFSVSEQRVLPTVRWLGRIKTAAAPVNADLRRLDTVLATRIVTAADRVAASGYDDESSLTSS